jgi:polyribonucleotide nucleotidyltransferase
VTASLQAASFPFPSLPFHSLPFFSASRAISIFLHMTLPVANENYAECVLREEAESRNAMQEGQTAASVVKKVASLNLTSESDFPALGKPVNTGNGTKVSGWSAGASIPQSQHRKELNPAATPIATPIATSAPTHISQVFQLPIDHQRPQSSRLADVCIAAAKETGTTIEASTSSRTKAISFVVKGRKEADISAAKRLLWSQLAQSGVIEVEVPETAIRFIIGPAGKTLHALQNTTATRIRIPKGDEFEGKLMISGDFEGVAMARDQILQIVRERTNKTTVNIDCPQHLLHFLWQEGISGTRQADLQASFPQVRITTSFRGSSEENGSISVTGDRDEAAQVASLLDSVTARLKTVIKSVSTQVPKGLHRYLVGPKAATRVRLEEETGCVIAVPAAASSSEDISIYGPEDRLLQGLSAVLELARSVCTQTVPLNAAAATLANIPGKYKSELRAIEKEHAVSIQVSLQPPQLEIDGRKEKVEEAIAAVGTALQSLSQFTAIDGIPISHDLFKHLIGKKGQNIQQLQRELQVEIHVSTDDDKVFVAGTDAQKVHAAVEHINSFLSVVADFTTATAKIDSKYQGMLIGFKGANVHKYQAKFPLVTIRFTPDSEDVTFKGPQADVEACRAEVIAEAEAIRHDSVMHSYQQALPLNSETAKALQDPKDVSLLHSLARQLEVKLLFKTEGSTEVCVRGAKGAVDAALPAIREQIRNISERGSLVFSVDPQHHGVLIGSEGRNLKHLHQKFGVKIDFPSRKPLEGPVSDENASIIKITGPKSNIGRARDELLDLLQYHLQNSFKESLTVPLQVVPMIIGKGGAKVESIRLETDCNVDVARGEEAAEITLSGTKEGVAKAKSLVMAIVKDAAEQEERIVSVPSKESLQRLTSVFKQRWFSFLDRMKDSSGIQVNVRRNEGTVVLRGKAANMAEAQKELEGLLGLIESGELDSIDLPEISSQYYGRILGPKGATIKAFIQQHSVDVQVPRAGEPGAVRIAGPKEKLAAAAAELRILGAPETVFRFKNKRIKAAVLPKLNDLLKGTAVEWTEHAMGVALKGSAESVAKAQELLAAFEALDGIRGETESA